MEGGGRLPPQCQPMAALRRERRQPLPPFAQFLHRPRAPRATSFALLWLAALPGLLSPVLVQAVSHTQVVTAASRRPPLGESLAAAYQKAGEGRRHALEIEAALRETKAREHTLELELKQLHVESSDGDLVSSFRDSEEDSKQRHVGGEGGPEPVVQTTMGGGVGADGVGVQTTQGLAVMMHNIIAHQTGGDRIVAGGDGAGGGIQAAPHRVSQDSSWDSSDPSSPFRRGHHHLRRVHDSLGGSSSTSSSAARNHALQKHAVKRGRRAPTNPGGIVYEPDEDTSSGENVEAEKSGKRKRRKNETESAALTPEAQIAEATEELARDATHELGLVQGLKPQGWFMVQLCVMGLCFLTSTCLSYYGDHRDQRAAFRSLSRSDEGSAAEIGRRGRAAEGHANVLDYLRIDPDGGLDRAGTIFSGWKDHGARFWKRLVRVGLVIGGGLANVCILSFVSYRILDAFCLYLGGTPVMRLAGLQHWSSMESQMRRQFLPLAALVAFIELTVITYLFAAVLHRLVLTQTSKDHFTKYDAMRDLAWGLLPHLATYSAMKSLRFAHPSFIADMWDDNMREPFFGHKLWSLVIQAMFFAISRFLALLLGLLAFCVKIVEAGAYFQNEESSILVRWGFVASFLYQVLMIILLEQAYSQRILRLFFAGEDTNLDDWEGLQMHVYQARVVQEIWRSYSGLHRIALLATFDHRDFTKLFLEEDHARKQVWVERTSRRRRLMKEKGNFEVGTPRTPRTDDGTPRPDDAQPGRQRASTEPATGFFPRASAAIGHRVEEDDSGMSSSGLPSN